MGQALKEIAASFGIKWDGSALEEGLKQVEKAKKGLVVFGGFLTATGLAVAKFAMDFENDAGALEDTANALNLNTTELQELEVAATRAGLRTEQFRGTLLRFQQNAEAAAHGGGQQAKVFDALGVKVKDASGHVRGTGELLTDLAGAFGRVQDPAQKAAYAHELFGRQGAKLATILKSGEGGIEALRGELAELGGGLTDDAVHAAGQLGDEFDRLRVVGNSLRSTIAVVLLPPITWLAEKTRDAVLWFNKAAKGSSIVQAVLVTLAAAAVFAGAQMLAAFMPLIIAMAPWVAGIAAVVLIVEDLITMFRGGDSVIGRFIDKMFGIGATKAVVRAVSEFWDSLTFAIGKAWDILKEFGRGMSEFLPQAWNSLKAALAPVGEWFLMFWGQIRTGFDAILRLAEKIPGLGSVVRGVRSALSSVGNAAAGTVSEAFSTGALSDAGQLLLGSAATTHRAVVSRGVGPSASTQVVQNHNPVIHVHGAGDPETVARRTAELVHRNNAAQLERAHAARRETVPSET